MSRYIKILKKLHDATENGSVRWQATADENAYRVGFGRGIIRIWRQMDDESDWRYTATLIDGEGHEVESASVWQSVVAHGRHPPSNELAFLPLMFEGARRSALNIDALLDEIEEGIDLGVTRAIPDDQD
jgi:hypothetical protein